ncbi:B3 domain-containing transcription factor VRN1 [Senna tora]|uniref:B3 domain-containing transcription factor VRN1 n=1 Tax=Senna tora TaxID=362788 RepID=A0A834SSL8_9FABA|nr:B3 domain-containing transcription factor VRN1 [Senna tora]
MASHFFKIILERSLQDGKLQVPNNFMKKYGGDMPNPLFLKPPDGTLWEIFWEKYDDGEVWFEKGWKEVAEHYSLQHGHLVVFKYEKGTCHIGKKKKTEDNQQKMDQEDSSKKCPKSKAIITIKERMKPLTCSEKVMALERVSTFMSKNPYFKIVIQPSYIFKALPPDGTM